MLTLEFATPSTRRANTSGKGVVGAAAIAVERLAIRWVVATTVAAWAVYVGVAVWLVDGRNFMINDAVSRTASAKLMVLSRDPHLAAVGFYWMPIPTVTRIPFVYLLEPFGRALLAGPVTSALFAAATIPVLVTIGRTLGLGLGLTIGLTAAYAFNPVVVFAAANGMSESTFGFFLVLTLLQFVRWKRSDDSRDLLMFGVGLAGCLACRYETFVLLPALLIGVALVVPAERRRSTLTLVAVPSAVLAVVWATVSRLITGDWFFWYNASRPTTATPPGAQWVPDDLNLTSAAVHVGGLLLAYAPALIPAALSALVLRRNWPTVVMLFATLLLLPAALAWQLGDGSTWMVPRFLVHTPLLATVTVMAVVAATRDRAIGTTVTLDVPRRRRAAGAVAWIAVAAIPLGAVTSTLYLADPDRAHAEGEYVMLGPLLGHDDPRTAAGFDASNEVFDADIDAFRELTADLDARLGPGERVVMDSLQATPFVMSRRPQSFIVPEDRDFEEILADPVGRFEYIVVMTGRAETEFSEVIATELERAPTDGGTWSIVADHDGAGTIYAFEPTDSEAVGR